jgi:site-specific DNA recombinase
VGAAGQKHGRLPFARGALYHLLSNPIYIGRISHKKLVYPGKHKPILDQKLWDQVVVKLEANRQSRHVRKETTSPNMLAGLLFYENGVRYTPHYSVKKGRRYRYYVSLAVINRDKTVPPIPRISAPDTEKLIMQRILSCLPICGD